MTHGYVAHPYFGAFFMLIFASVIFTIIVFLAAKVGGALAYKNTEKLKLSIYECGPMPTKQSNAISSHFYLFALLFILFDVEINFMFPWAVNFKMLGWFGFVEMIIFILLLGIGFVYAWKEGALKWQKIQ